MAILSGALALGCGSGNSQPGGVGGNGSGGAGPRLDSGATGAGGAAAAGGTQMDARTSNDSTGTSVRDAADSGDVARPGVDGGCLEQKIAITADMLSASSSYASYVPITAFDGDMSQNSGWSAAGGEQKAWLAVDFGTARAIGRVRVFPDRYISTDPSYAYLDRFRVDVWGGSDWIAASALISTPEEKWYEVNVNTTTQKLRIWAESDGNGPQIKEIEIYGPGCGAVPVGMDAGAVADAARPADVARPGIDSGCLEQKIAITADMLSASSSYSSYVPITAFDGDMSQNSGWSAAGGEQKAWLAVDFGTARAIGRVRVFPDRYISTDPSYAYLDRFRIDVWGGSDWIAASALISTPEEKWYEVNVNTTTQKLRIWAESDGNGPQIKEIEIYGPGCGAVPVGMDAGAVADTARPADVAQPGIDSGCLEQKIAITADMLSASSSYSSYVPITAFDGDMSQNSGWCAAGGEQKAWLAVDFGTARAVGRVRVFPDRYISTDPSYAYLDRFRIDVWGGSDWIAASALISTPEEKWYEVNVSTTTQKLRIWAESDGNGPQIKEIEIYGPGCGLSG